MHNHDDETPLPPRKPDPSRYRLPRPNKSTRQQRPSPGSPPTVSSHAPSIPSNSNVLSFALRVCQDCAGTCLQTVNACLDAGGETAGPRLQALLHDCADICETTARFIARRSTHIPHLCRQCAEICELCAHDLDAATDDDCTHRCAQACRRCAETCNGVTVHFGEG
jgi:hypothetical protein